MSKKAVRRGRPKGDAERVLICRHVVNISEPMEAAAKAFADANGVSRLTDALRMLLTKALRAEGLLN